MVIPEQLEAASTGALRNELGLAHEVITILTGWPGTAPGYVIIDALDAARTDAAVKTLHAIMEQVITSNTRWHVIASVRKFDLRYNTKLQELFPGTPPSIANMDKEFPTTRHVNIPTLSATELKQVGHQSPSLGALMLAAPARLRELLHLPFNLRLLAELLTTGIDPGALHPLTTQIELLDKYWLARIIRDDGDGDARGLVLGRTTNAMVQRRALRVPRAEAMANDAASSRFLKDLLSTHVLAEWTTPTGMAQRDFLTFPHHLLYDSAVARLAIPPEHHDLITRLVAEPDLFIAIRPSIELHYQRLWHADLTSFWDLTFQALTATIPEVGKLIGPGVAALHATDVTQFQPLIDRLKSTTTTTRDAGMAGFRHVLITLVATGTTAGTFTPSPWCALLDTATTAITFDLAFAVRPSLWFLSTHIKTLTAPERALLGTVARRFLTYALSIAPNDHGLLIAGITAVTKTATTDPPASISLLRQCLTQNHLQTIGYQTLRVLAEGVPPLATVEPGFVHDLYVAALQYRDTSKAVTSIGASQILPMTSNKQQYHDGGLYLLGEQYPAFLQAAPQAATTTLLAVINTFAPQGQTNTPQPRAVHLDGTTTGLIPDRSGGWDSANLYEHDLPIKMLDHLRARLEALAEQSADQTTLPTILNALTGAPLKALIWRRLLLVGTNRPASLGLALRSLAWDQTILTSADTTRLAGRFLQALQPLLGNDDRTRIEEAILTIPAGTPGAAHDRDRLVGCLDSAHLVTDASIAQHAIITQRDGVPNNDEDALDFHSLQPTPPPAPTDHFGSLLQLITAFSGQYRDSTPDTDAIDNVLPQLQELQGAINSTMDPPTPERALAAMTAVLQTCTRIARKDRLTAGQCEQLVALVLPATAHPTPEKGDDEDQQRPVGGWTDEPRILAAEGIILLARYPAACTQDVRAAIRRLSSDPVPVVRVQIVDYLGCLYLTAPDLLWELLEYDAATEVNPTVLTHALHLLRRLPLTDATRTVALSEQILDRVNTGPQRNDVRDACIHVFCANYVYANDAPSTRIIQQFIARPTNHARDLQRVILDLSAHYTSEEPAIRENAFALTQQILTAVIQAMRDMEAANGNQAPLPTAVQETYGGLLRCADEVGQRLYLASGAFKNPNPDRDFLAPGVFYQHAKPLIVLLADIGHPRLAHHLLDTLQHFIPLDPPGILLLVAEIVRTGSTYGYQYESLAEVLMVKIVERYLAEYRSILREHRECHTALMDILDVFVRVGSPPAHQLAYQLSDIYR